MPKLQAGVNDGLLGVAAPPLDWRWFGWFLDGLGVVRRGFGGWRPAVWLSAPPELGDRPFRQLRSFDRMLKAGFRGKRGSVSVQ